VKRALHCWKRSRLALTPRPRERGLAALTIQRF
jgi:hypothetical protein